jgi:hypothetical protein
MVHLQLDAHLLVFVSFGDIQYGVIKALPGALLYLGFRYGGRLKIESGFTISNHSIALAAEVVATLTSATLQHASLGAVYIDISRVLAEQTKGPRFVVVENHVVDERRCGSWAFECKIACNLTV